MQSRVVGATLAEESNKFATSTVNVLNHSHGALLRASRRLSFISLPLFSASFARCIRTSELAIP